LAVAVAFLDLDCQNCSAGQRIERGCDKDSPIPGKWGEIAGQKISQCPRRMITQLSAEYLRAFEMIQAGLGLPYGSGWSNHSRKFLDAIRIIYSEVEKRKAENVKRRT